MIYDELLKKNKLKVKTIQPIIIYYKDSISHSECYDISRNKRLDIDDIDDSYELDILETDDSIQVMIPRKAVCTLTRSLNSDCTLTYKNIETDLSFDEEMEYFFEIIEE